LLVNIGEILGVTFSCHEKQVPRFDTTGVPR